MRNAKTFSLVVGMKKTLLSKLLGFFCESLITKGTFPEKPDDPKHMWVSSFIDTIKPRLISVHVKGQEKDWDVNPVFGKYGALSNALSWQPEWDTGQIHRLKFLFLIAFWKYVPKNFSLGLPRN